MAQLRVAAQWLKILDQAEEWRISFEEDSDAKEHPFIGFGDISGWDRLDDETTGRGWGGRLMVPRGVAIDMMKALEQRARDELAKLGVKG